MIMPDFELITAEDRTLNMGRIVPVYPLTKGITQRFLRKVVDAALETYGDRINDIIPADVRARQGFGRMAEGIRQIHFPDSAQQQEKAGRRAAFEEFFLFQVCVLLRRLSITTKEGVSHRIEKTFMRSEEHTS